MEEKPHNRQPILNPKVHWSRAIGYFQLAMYDQSIGELEALPDQLDWSQKKRSLLIDIFQQQKKWTEMRDVAHELCLEFPQDAQWWVLDAYATRRSKSIEVAREILLEALLHHYEDALIRFNLACYACQLGSFGECLDFLKEAVRRDSRYKTMAMEDEDLEEVRETLREMGWGDVVV